MAPVHELPAVQKSVAGIGKGMVQMHDGMFNKYLCYFHMPPPVRMVLFYHKPKQNPMLHTIFI